MKTKTSEKFKKKALELYHKSLWYRSTPSERVVFGAEVVAVSVVTSLIVRSILNH